jgi:hypothetical protein
MWSSSAGFSGFHLASTRERQICCPGHSHRTLYTQPPLVSLPSSSHHGTPAATPDPLPVQRFSTSVPAIESFLVYMRCMSALLEQTLDL